MSRPVFAEINLAALRANLQRARAAAPGCKTLAVVKSNGYGHGLARVGKALDGHADALAVACVEEAIALREAGVAAPLVLLEGFFEERELALLARYKLQTVLHHPAQLEILLRAHLSQAVTVWLKVDTGMRRLGFLPEQVARAWEKLRTCPHVAQPPKLMTHLACADELENAMTARQLEVFAESASACAAEYSIANSAGILGWPQAHREWNRPGIMLYGISPFPERNGADEGLQPAMHLQTALISVKPCRRGDTVGYGASAVCPQDMPVGVAAIGYGDGYPRHAPSGTPVLVNGVSVPLIGRVSMDMIMLDLRPCPQAQIGDPVVLWGRGLPAETIAHHAGTIAYELLTHITPRVQRREVG